MESVGPAQGEWEVNALHIVAHSQRFISSQESSPNLAHRGREGRTVPSARRNASSSDETAGAAFVRVSRKDGPIAIDSPTTNTTDRSQGHQITVERLAYLSEKNCTGYKLVTAAGILVVMDNPTLFGRVVVRTALADYIPRISTKWFCSRFNGEAEATFATVLPGLLPVEPFSTSG